MQNSIDQYHKCIYLVLYFQYFLTYKLGKDSTNTDERNREIEKYATYFLNYVGFAAQIPNVLFNWVSVFLHIR